MALPGMELYLSDQIRKRKELEARQGRGASGNSSGANATAPLPPISGGSSDEGKAAISAGVQGELPSNVVSGQATTQVGSGSNGLRGVYENAVGGLRQVFTPEQGFIPQVRQSARTVGNIVSNWAMGPGEKPKIQAGVVESQPFADATQPVDPSQDESLWQDDSLWSDETMPGVPSGKDIEINLQPASELQKKYQSAVDRLDNARAQGQPISNKDFEQSVKEIMKERMPVHGGREASQRETALARDAARFEAAQRTGDPALIESTRKHGEEAMLQQKLDEFDNRWGVSKENFMTRTLEQKESRYKQLRNEIIGAHRNQMQMEHTERMGALQMENTQRELQMAKELAEMRGIEVGRDKAVQELTQQMERQEQQRLRDLDWNQAEITDWTTTFNMLGNVGSPAIDDWAQKSRTDPQFRKDMDAFRKNNNMSVGEATMTLFKRWLTTPTNDNEERQRKGQALADYRNWEKRFTV